MISDPIPNSTDGDFSVRALAAPTKKTFPFLNWPTKDAVTAIFERLYEIARGSYAPFAPLATLPDEGTEDPADANAYLLEEDDGVLDIDGTQRVRCLFGHVPPTQIKPSGSVNYSRPAVPGSGANRNYGSETTTNAGMFYQPDTTQNYFHAYSRRAVATDQGVSTAPTGGTDTTTFGASTTAANTYNDSAATRKAKLDGLASIIAYGGLATFTGVYTDPAGFVATFNDFATATLATGSLTHAADSVLSSSAVLSNGGWTQQVSIALSRTDLISTGGSINGAGLIGFTSSANSVVDTPLANRVLTLVLQSSTPVTGGTFTYTLYGQTTAPIAYDASPAAVVAALNALSNVAAHGGVTWYSTGNWFNFAGGQLSFGNSFIFGGPPFTAGTFTSTIFTQTTGTIAYNASVATIQAAYNALSEVAARGGVVVTGVGLSADGTTISYTLTFSAAAMSGASSLTPAPGAVTVAIVAGTNGRQQTLKLTASQVARLLTTTNPHGLSPGDTAYFKQGSSYVMARTDWTYVSANQISLNVAVAPWSTNTAITEIGRYQRTYAPTPAEHQTRTTVQFWLPGVTTGITTDADIPLPASPISDTVYLNAVVSPTAYVPFSSGNLDQWHGPILTRDKTEILLPP